MGNRKTAEELQTTVYEEVDLKHPIECNGHDICGLAKRGVLKSKFKAAQLKQDQDTFSTYSDCFTVKVVIIFQLS